MKIVNEAIKHLGPKSDEELRQSVKNLPFEQKMEFASENNLPWLAKEAEEDLNKHSKELPMDKKFFYAKKYKFDWLQKDAEKEFREKDYKIPKTFIALYEYLKKQLGDFDYEIDYLYGDNYNLKMLFSANNVHFLISQNVNTSLPEIKFAKKTGDVYFFTEGAYISEPKQMMAYIKAKIKQSK